MKNRMRLIEDHITRLHCDVHRLSIVPIDFQWPGFVEIGCDIDNGGTDQREPIHMGRKNASSLHDKVVNTTDSQPNNQNILHNVRATLSISHPEQYTV